MVSGLDLFATYAYSHARFKDGAYDGNPEGNHVVDHLGGDQRHVIERYDEPGESVPRMLYSSRDSHTAPTGAIPVYPPGFFSGRDDGEGDLDQDPTRP